MYDWTASEDIWEGLNHKGELTGTGRIDSLYWNAAEVSLTGLYDRPWPSGSDTVQSEGFLAYDLDSQTGAITKDGNGWELSGVTRDAELSGVIGYNQDISLFSSVEHTVELTITLHVGAGGTMTREVTPGGVGSTWYSTWGLDKFDEKVVVLKAHKGPE